MVRPRLQEETLEDELLRKIIKYLLRSTFRNYKYRQQHINVRSYKDVP